MEVNEGCPSRGKTQMCLFSCQSKVGAPMTGLGVSPGSFSVAH